jgi:hypothetical protein
MSQALGLRRQILFLGVSGGPQRPRESNHREAEEEEKKSRLNTGTGTPRGHGWAKWRNKRTARQLDGQKLTKWRIEKLT